MITRESDLSIEQEARSGEGRKRRNTIVYFHPPDKESSLPYFTQLIKEDSYSDDWNREVARLRDTPNPNWLTHGILLDGNRLAWSHEARYHEDIKTLVSPSSLEHGFIQITLDHLKHTPVVSIIATSHQAASLLGSYIARSITDHQDVSMEVHGKRTPKQKQYRLLFKGPLEEYKAQLEPAKAS